MSARKAKLRASIHVSSPGCPRLVENTTKQKTSGSRVDKAMLACKAALAGFMANGLQAWSKS